MKGVDQMSFELELSDFLHSCGADVVGYADLTSLIEGELKYGIAVGVKLPKALVKSIAIGPNHDYYETYNTINAKLDQIVIEGAKYIAEQGYKAVPQTVESVQEFDDYRTKMPHKTVAVHAGLGWIGKSALFVSEQYGSAIRLSSILTNAKFSSPMIMSSKCGDCIICKNACPGNAIFGKLWELGKDRNELLNPLACRKRARELAYHNFGIEITLCGKCIEICPYTQRYLKQDEVDK